MRFPRPSKYFFIFCGLLVLVAAAAVHGEENKQLMLAFTTDTNGELEPCG
jgi:hypothetical protein